MTIETRIPRRLGPLLLCSSVAVSCAGTSGPDPATRSGGTPKADAITGLWVGARDYAPTAPRSIEVSVGPALSASLDGSRAELTLANGVGIAVFSDGSELRLRAPSSEAKAIRGHWIQPASPILGQRYATPVTLARDGRVFRGQAIPMASRLELFLVIKRDQEGVLTAFVREHGQNIGRFFREMTIAVAGDALTFTRENGQPAFTAILAGPSLTIKVDRLGEPLGLTRSEPGDEGHFAPRGKATARYQYAPPTDQGDGWDVASLSDVAIDPAPVARMFQEIVSAETTSWRSPALHAILVARRGKLVLEEYFHGTRLGDLHDTRSAGKSFASTLVGIASDRGFFAPSDRVASYLGGATDDPRKDAMTLEHLLTMSSGLECDDNDYDGSRGNEDRMQEQEDEPDWHRYAWSLPMVRAPGAAGIYCSAGINLLGAPLARATKMWIPDFFATALAEPLGIERYHFNLMPTGEGYLAGGIRLRPRDFLKLGQLFLDGGLWRGERVVSEAWIAAATAPHASINGPNDYGYAWWRLTYNADNADNADGRELAAYYASGNGGQMVIVVPDAEIVIAFMAGNYGDGATRDTFREDLALRIVRAALASP